MFLQNVILPMSSHGIKTSKENINITRCPYQRKGLILIWLQAPLQLSSVDCAQVAVTEVQKTVLK